MPDPTPLQTSAMHLIESAMDDLFSGFDRAGVTVTDLEALGETEIAEWYQTWIDDGEEDSTEGKTPQEVARMVHDRQTSNKPLS